jgi:uncharacterized protein (TIRG00374 family)
MKKNLFKLLKTVLPLLIGVYLIWYFFKSMSKESLDYFYLALKRANYFWIFLALFFSFICYCIRAYRWKYTLEPLGYKTSFWNRYHALMIGYLVNLTIPRAGEASRAVMLYRSDGIPFSSSFGTIIAERAIDLLMLGTVCIVSMFIGYDNFMELFHQIKVKFSGNETDNSLIKYIFSSLLLLGLIALIFIMKFKPKIRNKIISLIKGLIDGVLAIFKCKNPLAYFTQTLIIWILYIVYFGIAFLCLEETSHFPLDGILLAFIVGALGISFTNGGIGTFPLLVGMVVVFYLKDDFENAIAIGNALGMLIWVSQTILLIFLGLISLILLPKNYAKEHVKN